MPSDSGETLSSSTLHLVKSEDLNHHHTLYAGRCVEWCVQIAYITAEQCFEAPQPLVFMSIRSLSMRAPARVGDILEYSGTVDYIGDSTIGVRVDAKITQPRNDQKTVATGTFLFCTVDGEGKSLSHGLPPLQNGNRPAQERWVRSIEDERRGAKL